MRTKVNTRNDSSSLATPSNNLPGVKPSHHNNHAIRLGNASNFNTGHWQFEHHAPHPARIGRPNSCALIVIHSDQVVTRLSHVDTQAAGLDNHFVNRPTVDIHNGHLSGKTTHGYASTI
tara:strand:+ start:5389 stop:5745 length:357 start_codon:yes stop_codon:yes gene_type:complete